MAPFFWDAVVGQPLVCSNLLIQLVLKNNPQWIRWASAVLNILLERTVKDVQQRRNLIKKRYWITSKTDVGFISSDVMLYNGCFSDTELVFAEKIQVLMCCICLCAVEMPHLCLASLSGISVWPHPLGARVKTWVKNEDGSLQKCLNRQYWTNVLSSKLRKAFWFRPNLISLNPPLQLCIANWITTLCYKNGSNVCTPKVLSPSFHIKVLVPGTSEYDELKLPFGNSSL